MKKTYLTILLFFVLETGLAYAQGGGGTPAGGGGGTPPTPINIKIENPFKVGDNLYDLMKAIVNNIILPIGGVLCVLAFIYSGFKYVMARGDEKAIGEAHNALLYSAVGTALLLGAWLFANVIKETVNQLI